MSKNKSYSPDQMNGKYIACSLLLSGAKPELDAVRYAEGPNKDMPVLYNSIQDAEEDNFFDDACDHVIPANEYFDRVQNNNFKF